MDLILRQLGDLVLGSVPTIILFVLLVAAYGLLVRRPLDKVLAERRARTTGAVEQAQGAISAAEAETAVYEDKLRAAKADLLSMREARRKSGIAERDLVIEQVRQAAQARVRIARDEIERSADAVRQHIESLSTELSAQVLRAVLPAGANSREAAQ